MRTSVHAMANAGLWHLPGDITIERGNAKYYFPIATCLLISVVITLVIWAMNR
jgi:hypothetical protein